MENTTAWLQGLIDKAVAGAEWVAKKFEQYFGLYSTKYSWAIIVILILWVAKNVFKIKLNIGK